MAALAHKEAAPVKHREPAKIKTWPKSPLLALGDRLNNRAGNRIMVRMRQREGNRGVFILDPAGRFSVVIVDDLDISETEFRIGPQRLEDGFFGGETGRQMLERMTLAARIFQLTAREHTVQKDIPPAPDRLFQFFDLNDIDTYTYYHIISLIILLHCQSSEFRVA